VGYLVDALLLLLGSVFGWATALIFARKQARDLDRSVERLEEVSGQLTGALRQEVLSVRDEVRNVGGQHFYLIELLADAGVIDPRRDEHGAVLVPVGKSLEARWQVRTLEQERIAELEEALRQAHRPPVWRRIWRFITP
jgi:hypothetical protein